MQTVSTFLGQIQVILDSVVPFIVGLAVFIVIWGFSTTSRTPRTRKRRAGKTVHHLGRGRRILYALGMGLREYFI